MKLKRIFSLALGTALALSLVACGSNDNPAADNSKPGAVQPPSNYVDCGTLEEAIEMAGIEISIPEVIKGYDDCTFRANKTDGMIEVIFQNDDDEIRFRKGLGDKAPRGRLLHDQALQRLWRRRRFRCHRRAGRRPEH